MNTSLLIYNVYDRNIVMSPVPCRWFWWIRQRRWWRTSSQRCQQFRWGWTSPLLQHNESRRHTASDRLLLMRIRWLYSRHHLVAMCSPSLQNDVILISIRNWLYISYQLHCDPEQTSQSIFDSIKFWPISIFLDYGNGKWIWKFRAFTYLLF